MYLLIPDVFLVPVYYAEKHILNIEKIIILSECNSYGKLTNKTIDRTEVVIGVALPDQTALRWNRTKKFMEDYGSGKGVTMKIENADFDVAKQASQVDNLISQGIDVLILVPVDSLASATLVEKAHKAGIKVINYDRLIANSDADVYVSFNGTRVGELQGQYLTQRVPRGNYIILSGDPRNFNAKLYKDGAMKYIQPLADVGNIKIVADKSVEEWSSKNSFNIVKGILSENNKIDAILAPDDSIAGGAVEALREQGLEGKVVVTGQNADLAGVRRIIEGTQAMTVFKDDREEARIAIDTAIKLVDNTTIGVESYVNNGKRDVPSILLTPIVVDRNNMNKVIIDSGYLKQNEVFSSE